MTSSNQVAVHHALCSHQINAMQSRLKSSDGPASRPRDLTQFSDTHPRWGLCTYTPIHIGYVRLDVQHRGTINNISTSENDCVTTDMIHSGYTETCTKYIN